MVPEEKKTAVSKALQETFGVTEPEDIRDLTERPGSNRAFRIIVQGSTYLLRINTRLGDMKRQFDCMQAAADAGLAPRALYTSIEDRLSITDFLKAAPLPAQEALVRIPAALRTLHALPPFPKVSFNTTCTFLLNEGPGLSDFLQKFRASNILPNDETGELFARYRQLTATYAPLDSDIVASHNDLFKPDNILFDGDRLWFVDWEAAFQNDRYADLAVVANMIVANDQDESVYLREYFGAPANEYQKARFYLMKQVAHMFYAMAFLTMGSVGKPIDWSEPVAAYRDFQRRFWAHDVAMNDNSEKAIFGRVHWNELASNMRQPRFDEALKIVSEGRAQSGYRSMLA
jgi:hypothetical protein